MVIELGSWIRELRSHPLRGHKVRFHELDANRTIYFVRGAFRPGSDAVARSLVELAIGLGTAGYDVHIVTWTSPDESPLLKHIHEENIHSLAPARRRGAYQSLDRLAFIFLLTLFLIRRAAHGTTIVCLEDPSGLGWAPILARLSGCNLRVFAYLMDLQSVQYLQLGHVKGIRSMRDRLRIKADSLTWSFAHEIVVLGSCMRSAVQAVNSRTTIRVIPIWQDSSRIRDVSNCESQAMQLSPGKFVALYHGHATYRQPMQAILTAAMESLTVRDLEFVIVGNGPSIEWLSRRVAEEKLTNIRVNPYEYREADMLSVLSRGDVHLAILDERATGTCVPSKSYTAMALRRPIVYLGSECGQAAIDILASGGGFVVPTNQPRSLQKHLLNMVNNETDAKAMGLRGYSFFLENRELGVIVGRWIDMLNSSH